MHVKKYRGLSVKKNKIPPLKCKNPMPGVHQTGKAGKGTPRDQPMMCTLSVWVHVFGAVQNCQLQTNDSRPMAFHLDSD